jgi:hypothetical protein
MAGGVGGQINLLAAAGNGDGTTIQLPRWNNIIESHLRTLFVWGTFDSGTVKLQISPDDTTWFDVPGADAITAQATLNVEFRAPYVRCTASGGGGSISVNAKLL